MLETRILSALVLAPLPLLAVWFGSPWLPILTVIAGGIMAWEWALLCRSGRLGTTGVLMIAAVIVAIAAAVIVATGPGLVVALIGAAAIFGVADQWTEPEPVWTGFGVIWIAVPCICLLWVAAADGRFTVLWMLGVIWATDIGAYAAGRTIGGPLLAPRLSPRKTWAGLIGGVFAAAAVGWLTASLMGVGTVLWLVLVSAGLAVVGQFGDLAESMAKRRFGVKDSSALIPGHGGLLDRLDGLLAVVPAVALLSILSERSVLVWR